MSAPPHPWRRLAASWPGVPVVRTEFVSPYLHAETRWRAGRPVAVVLNARLTQVQARCAVAHECEHLDRGQPCAGLRARIEQQVVVATARYLLPDVAAVARAVAVYDERRAADELWVTHSVLADRLACVTDFERTLMRRVIRTTGMQESAS